jgi:SWI/SNF-related matrix-associated actin-dependent regulator 1 of chromatin subfamily A
MSARSLILKDDLIEVRFPMDVGVLEAVKRIPGRRFINDVTGKYWAVPLGTVAAMSLMSLASEHKFIVEESLAKSLTKLAKNSKKDPAAIAAGGQPVIAPHPDGVALHFSYSEYMLRIVKAIPGRKFNDDKVWSVPPSAEAAAGLMALLTDHGFIAMGDAAERINAMVEARKDVVDMSRAGSADIVIPAPEGLEYLPFQKAGIAYAVGRKNTLIADEPGLGKTIEAIGFSNMLPDARSILVVCTGSGRVNWKREFTKWDTKGLSVGIATKEEFPASDVVIIHYDLLKQHQVTVRQRKWDILVADEAHKMKNYKTVRAQQVLGNWKSKLEPIKAGNMLFLTGTPILNRPEELLSLVRALAPATFRDRNQFLERYCGAYHDGYGLKTTGGTNLEELQEILRATCMVRRLKAEVQKELPPKIREIVEIPAKAIVGKEQKAVAEMYGELLKLRVAVELAKASDDQGAYERAVSELSQRERLAFKDMAKLRQKTALAKVPFAIEHINDALENGKVIVFAHHAEVIDKLRQEYGEACVVVDGRVKMDDRQALVDKFQTDPECMLMVAGMEAAGEVYTMTASSHEIFLELGHTPGGMTQCEDRAHRIGQKNTLLVQHLVLEGSIDAAMARRLIAKQMTIDRALNNAAENEALDRAQATKIDGPELDVPEVETMGSAAEILAQAGPPSTADLKRAELQKIAETLTPKQIVAIHGGLRMLANVCDGASSYDSSGYNKFDSHMGHVLAEKEKISAMEAALGRRMLTKYRRQLGEELMAEMGVGMPKEKAPAAKRAPRAKKSDIEASI